MKRVLAVLLTVPLLLLSGCGPTRPVGPIDITAAFTDPNFRAAVYEHISKTAPEPILDTDVAAIRELDICSKAIQSLIGLEHFTGLEKLVCWRNQLAKLPQLPTSLLELNCDENQLTALPKLPSNLRYLSCDNNQLATLPRLPSGLSTLWCSLNQLTKLPKLPSGLQWLHCGYNQLTTLPRLPASLEVLFIDYNQFAKLPELPSDLQQLFCRGNQLITLDVTGLSLSLLDCRYNNMTDESNVKGFTGVWDNAWDDDDETVNYYDFLFYPQNQLSQRR